MLNHHLPSSDRRSLALCLALLLVLPAAAGAQPHFPSTPDLADMLRFLVEDKATPGIALGVLEADGTTRVVTSGSTGTAVPISEKTVFEIGSINKTFTGTLLADMVAKKEVALSDPISKYLPKGVTAPARNGRAITLLDLATHRSGLPRLPDNHTPADPQNPYADYTVEKLYTFLSKHQLRRDPGAEAEYSNLGFGLLGHLLARAADTSYQNLVRTRILQPVGMTMTGWAVEGALGKTMAKGHAKEQVVPYWFATEAIEGAGGLRSSLADMMKYLRAQVGPPRTSLERAIRAAHVERAAISATGAIGLGWQIAKYEGRTLVTHGGGTGGFSTYIGFDPDKRVGFVMLTNTGALRDDIGMDFLRRGPPLAIPEVKLTRAQLQPYVGTYEVAAGREMTVRMEPDGRLTIQVPGNVRFRMHPESDGKFFLKRTPWRFVFTKNTAGQVTGLEGDLEGTKRVATKIK
jgi:D-alanyl-D-alanine-carboxypeptidase/D-alanyl-D-alanine-endopeptidase